MRGLRTGLVTAVALLAVPAAGADDEAPPKRPWPGGERAALEVPADVWDRVVAGTVPGRRPLGYTGDEMRNYGGREHLLRSVENLFRDARAVPRETGRITDDLLKLAAEGKVDEVVQRCWSLTDVPAGRMVKAPEGDDWGLEGIAKGATCTDVATHLARHPLSEFGDVASSPDEPPPPEFLALPEPVQRFALRLAIGWHRAYPWLRAGRVAAERALVAAHMREEPSDDVFDTRQVWDVRPLWETVLREPAELLGPWSDEREDQSATLASAPFTLLRECDRASTSYGSVVFLAHASRAVAEFLPWLEKGGREEIAKLRSFKSALLGPVEIRGPHDDESGGGWVMPVVIELGGNDRTTSAQAAAWGRHVLAVVIDLSGDDVHDAGEHSFALGSGVFGLGAVIDLGGNDTYTVKSDGLGRGLFGTGLLWDLAGDDTYVVKTKWGQGAAHAGVGVLLDAAGNDRYECAEQSQGMGSTLGCGLLLDLAGNDVYHCRDDGNVSALYLNQSVAMAQGCGYGRRADIGDGRSLAGGWGLLVDGAGDDRYHAQCWAQGAGYWWGVGVLEDRGGDDVYENGKYSLGAAAHFAVGVQVDLAGDDRYNVGVATTKNQFQGHARDGSIGVSIDGDGNDRYSLKNLCAGSADLASLALFWDRRGDDVYEAVMEKDLGDAAPFGSATVYPPHRSFRDDLPAVGVFLDTGGKDTYSGDPRGLGADGVHVATGARDGASWRESKGPASFGFGWDLVLWE
jgi:hypothetical protein